MNDKMKTLQLNQFNKDYLVTLIYDKCKSGESQYGPWKLYGVEHRGEQQAIFTEDALHQQLQKYEKGTKLVIRRNQDANGELEWQVIPQNGKGISPRSYIDKRTADIHRQVALKTATRSIGQTTKPWTNEDLQEIKSRMDKLLDILDGNKPSDLPF